MAATNLTVTKALDLLDLLGRAEQPVRLMDLAARLELPESTTHRLLASLAERGYVQRRADIGTYGLGWKIVVLARSLASDSRLVQDMRQYLVKLVQKLGQTVNLAVLSNDEVMYLDCQTPERTLALYTAPGFTFPAHATSLGKVLLAHLPESERSSILARMSLPPLTPNTITDRASLESVLDEVRRLGFAIDYGELRTDVSCLAAPIIDDKGHARAAISMTAPSAELPADWESTFTPILTEMAKEASLTLYQHRT